jgi:hypothetical protein
MTSSNQQQKREGAMHNNLPFQSIYLAGKISKGDWRADIVPEINESDGGCPDGSSPPFWPRQESAVFGMDYVGPYFRRCDHGCYHGPASHGTAASRYAASSDDMPSFHDRMTVIFNQRVVLHHCTEAIKRADLIFAWIDTREVYGTLAELGLAKGLGKTVWIAMPEPDRELWFVCQLADRVAYTAAPLEGLKMLLGYTLFEAALPKKIVALR